MDNKAKKGELSQKKATQCRKMKLQGYSVDFKRLLKLQMRLQASNNKFPPIFRLKNPLTP